MKTKTLVVSPVFLATFALSMVASAAALPQDQYFNSNGVKIHFVDQGQGEPVILVHGLGGNLQIAWFATGIFDKLAVDHRVIAMDVRGHGQSDKPHDPKQYGPEIGLDIVRLMDHLAIKKAHIVGYSMGGIIASQLLTLHSQRFITATLLSAVGRFEWTDSDAQFAKQEASEMEKECVSRSLIYRLAPTNGPKPNEEAIRKLSTACFADKTQDRFAIAALVRSPAWMLVDSQKAGAVKVPTLGIVGSLDVNSTYFEALKKMRSDLKLIVIDGATHGGDKAAMRTPEFISALREFLSSHRQSS